MTEQITKKQTTTVRLRDSNIELYRIISMLLIVAHHYVVNSGLIGAGGPIYADVLSCFCSEHGEKPALTASF